MFYKQSKASTYKWEFANFDWKFASYYFFVGEKNEGGQTSCS